jgi:hypothetical protein
MNEQNVDVVKQTTRLIGNLAPMVDRVKQSVEQHRALDGRPLRHPSFTSSRTACRWHDTVHTEVFHHLPVMVKVMHQSFDGKS